MTVDYYSVSFPRLIEPGKQRRDSVLGSVSKTVKRNADHAALGERRTNEKGSRPERDDRPGTKRAWGGKKKSNA